VEVPPPEAQVNAQNVYTNDGTATAVMTGVYTRLASGSPGPNISQGTSSFSMFCGLAADEYTLFGSPSDEQAGYYKNTLVTNVNTNTGTSYWNVLYDHIYYVNSAIQGYESANGLTDAVKKQLLGEAKFMRAFFYFYLVNLYGDVPLVTTTDYKTNSTLPRSPKVDVYQQMIADLTEAENLLSPKYLDGNLQNYAGTSERIRPTKWAAAALLARVYLYNGSLTGDASNFVKAESQATSVIGNTALYDTVSLNNVFLSNSKEAIWQLQVVKANQNTDDAKMFIITTGFSTSIPVRLSDTLLNSFETGDLRKVNGNWVNSVTLSGNTYYYPYKYKNRTATVTEYLMVLRLAEQFLIRAEARAQQGNLNGAKSDLNIIRNRAGLADNTTATDKNSLLSAILHERQVELFSEWGHRWFDLKRTGAIDPVMAVMTPKKGGGSWQSYKQLNPIPYSEIQNNSSLTQNPNY
jgi:hypothetical protein